LLIPRYQAGKMGERLSQAQDWERCRPHQRPDACDSERRVGRQGVHQIQNREFQELKSVVAGYTPERVAEITGVDPESLRKAAEAYANSRKAMIVYAMGITQHVAGTDNVKSCANLAMLTGHVGYASAGVNPLRGQNNVQGACDMGALPNVYTDYQPVADLNVKKEI